MDICFVVTKFPQLSETFVLSQVLFALRAGHNVIVACVEYDKKLPLPDAVQSDLAKVKIARWPVVSEGVFARMPKAIKNTINSRLLRITWRLRLKADVVVAHFGYGGLRVTKAQHGWKTPIPLVTIFHGRDVSVPQSRNGLAVYKDLFATGERFLCVNEPFAKMLVDAGAPSDRVSTHHLGIPVSRYDFAPRPVGTPLRLVSVCRLVEKKGIDVALNALAHLRIHNPELDWRYDIGGDGPLLADLQAQAQTLGLSKRVRFLGALPHDETLRRISEADAMLLPSVTAADGDQEGIPVTLMEAMALGTLVCTTRHSGIPELVKHGETGFLSEERDHLGLATNILGIFSQSSINVASNARKMVEVHFNEDVQNALLLETCKTLSRGEGETRSLNVTDQPSH